MGFTNGGNVIAKVSNVVSSELHRILTEIVIKKMNNNQPIDHQLRIDCDLSNIIHKLSHRHSRIYSISLVRAVANVLKHTAKELMSSRD